MHSNSGHFKKGKSGNPNGRPKVIKEIQELARSHSVKAFEVLVALMDSKDAKVRLHAANAILDRGYGKPSQAHELIGTSDNGPIVPVIKVCIKEHVNCV